MVLHEVLHELKRTKARGMVLKIDFEKAYDRVRWDFIEQVMIGKGFPQKWINWVMSIVKDGKVCINVNGERRPILKPLLGVQDRGILCLPYSSIWLLTLWVFFLTKLKTKVTLRGFLLT